MDLCKNWNRIKIAETIYLNILRSLKFKTTETCSKNKLYLYLSIRVLHLLQYVGFEDRETTHFSTLLVISESPFRSTNHKKMVVVSIVNNHKKVTAF